MTFDVKGHIFVKQEYGWKNWYETFCVCRRCERTTIFVLTQSLAGHQQYYILSDAISKNPDMLLSVDNSLNKLFDVDRYISLRDESVLTAPDHLPSELEKVFREGAGCYSIGAYNAAATMFRLCLDLASRPLLPDPAAQGVSQPNHRERRDLGLRLPWLFKHGLIPRDLEDLASCVREEGNDGAHVGNLSKHELDDLVDFVTSFLERLVTEPKKLELAKQRRTARRSG
ncbi:MAG: DUF4145 domain-containing protein [Hyphomicrobiaceae bacterium]|nr:DUF4145 domain-containing protein [Hyphomicrobiaceae bacterium]